MDNPWTLLRRTPPFVLPMDADIIETFNSWRPPDADVRIRTQHLPEPFIGKRDAPILILGLNPRYTSENDAYHDGHAYFADVHRRNLMHEVMEYPFYPLDPKLEGSPTYTYWVTGYGTVPAALGRVIRACQPDGQYRVAQNILAVELGAYPSENWSPDYPFFPSQRYSNFLVQQAIDRNALIVVRNKRGWLDRFPNLQTYSKCRRLSSQNPSVAAGRRYVLEEIVDIITRNTLPRPEHDIPRWSIDDILI